MNKYIIDEERLIELLAAELELQQLEWGGVDNWCWYGVGRKDFLLEAIDGRVAKEDIPEDIDYEYVAKLDLADYKKIERE